MEVQRFWDFSVRTYRTASVPEACLSLQNEHGVDVNMLLYCVWVGAVAGSFDAESFKRAHEYSVEWAENVVIPLRKARTWMKHTGCQRDPVPASDCMNFREDIKGVEFAAEKMQQEVLESMLAAEKNRDATNDRRIADVTANLQLYFGEKCIPVTDEVRRKLSVIIRAALPDAEERVIENALRR